MNQDFIHFTKNTTGGYII